ncbi:MAG: hypothetical protein MOP51_491 [Citricoccus sp.]|nr:hypothetical protein [Citricoccus sp. WCRC_4]
MAQAEELARKFENYDPAPADQLAPKAVAVLRSAVTERSQAERHLMEAVREARRAGLSWAAIGALVGTSGEATRQRYASTVT